LEENEYKMWHAAIAERQQTYSKFCNKNVTMKTIIYYIFITFVSISAIRAQDSSFAKNTISFKDITIDNISVLNWIQFL